MHPWLMMGLDNGPPSFDLACCYFKDVHIKSEQIIQSTRRWIWSLFQLRGFIDTAQRHRICGRCWFLFSGKNSVVPTPFGGHSGRCWFLFGPITCLGFSLLASMHRIWNPTCNCPCNSCTLSTYPPQWRVSLNGYAPGEMISFFQKVKLPRNRHHPDSSAT